MSKTLRSQILKTVKESESLKKKENVTFRISKNLTDDLRSDCEKNNVSVTSVIEALIKDYLGGKSGN